jgi:hypothetical protein
VYNFQDLSFAYNNLGDSSAVTLSNLFHSGIHSIDVSFNEWSDIGLDVLCSTITTTPQNTLTSLNLHGNPIGRRGGFTITGFINVRRFFKKYLCSSKHKNCHVKELDIGNTDQDTQGIISVLNAVEKTSKITSLNIENPRLIHNQVTILYWRVNGNNVALFATNGESTYLSIGASYFPLCKNVCRQHFSCNYLSGQDGDHR